ncbi:hypothetical protein F4804DRAFT_341796 [Jackrogersella minutella]|nr:hypothetical protein F4804DRAFT_341796 [Jackrogersella minutella]
MEGFATDSRLKIKLRPSNSAPSLKPTSKRPESLLSTGSRGRSFRHGLLKHDTPADQPPKDLPIPPVLTLDPTPPSIPSPDESNIILTEPVYRVLLGGEKRKDIVDLSNHIHKEHSSAVKVRPAPGLIPEAEAHGGHLGISKVQPALERVREKETIHQSETLFQPELSSEEPFVLEHLHHGHSLTPSVRPSVDLLSLPSSEHAALPNDIHEGHIWVHKVQPYHESSSVAFKTEDDSLPRLVVTENNPKPEDSSKENSYWGFFPTFGEQKDEKASVVNEPSAREISQEEQGNSITSRSESRNKSVSIPHVRIQPSPKSIGNSENVRYDNGSTISLEKALNNDPSRNGSVLQDKGKGRKVSTASISPTSYPRLVESEEDRDDQEQPASPEKIDPWRAAAWLRQFLGYSEPTNSNLTQLPEKSHPRHEDHDDYPNDIVDAMASRVTTFSEKSAADAGTMDTTMNNLERLLDEALFLANEGTEHDHCEYVDDGDLPPHLQNKSELIQPDMDENIGLSSNEDVNEPIYPKTPPIVFVGAAEGSGHGCEALYSRAVETRGLIKPDMRSGNIKRLSYSDQGRSAHKSRRSKRKHTTHREVHHDISDDDCVLPMPPPDSQLKRQHLSPIPHAYDEDDPMGLIKHRTKDVPNSREVREYIRVFHQPPITPRSSSRNLREDPKEGDAEPRRSSTFTRHCHRDVDVCSLDGGSDDVVDFSTQYNTGEVQGTEVSRFGGSRRMRNQDASITKSRAAQRKAPAKRSHELRNISLRRRSHVSIRDGQRFSLTKSVKRQPTIARDWSPIRKRFVASVACISTALVGVLVGIYAGLVPSIQYYIADFNHYSILGNVGMFLGMAVSTFLGWPLPLLHGRKPYIVCSLCIAMPLLFPQAIAVSVPRSPYTSVWRWALLLPRAIMGCALGFANMNFHSILTDLFGASLMSSNPHQEVVDHYDVRRHGGGLGVWLGIWTWCFIGSLGIGFVIGAVVIDSLQPSWGLYISIMLIAVVLLLNVLCPEVRRSAWRRSVAEVRTGSGVSRRVARGEIMMHRVKDGPKWWGQEMYHGVALSFEMLRQPGFVIMALYSAWIYAQVVLIIVLLGSLTSRYYRFRSPFVAAAVSSVAIGALLAVPFQMANLFSRARSTGPLTNSMTFDKRLTWTSHLIRRAIFVIVLPIAGILYTIVSSGPPVHIVFPCIFAAMIGFLSCMTGRRSKSGKEGMKRTNYSSFPRVTAGFNTIHSMGFIFAAGATSVGGIATRALGQRAATGVVASRLFLHSLLLLGVFARFRHVQIIPNSKTFEMDKWTNERRDSLRRRASAIATAKANGLNDISEIPEEDVG